MLEDPASLIAHCPLGGTHLHGSHAPPETLVLRRLDEAVAASPDAVALEQNGQALTYAEFDALVDAYAAGCVDQGVQPGDLVIVWQKRSIETVAAIWGILRAGACFVPFPANAPPGRIRSIAERHGIRFAMSDEPGLSGLTCIKRGASKPQRLDISPGDLAYVIFTSGSTGEPKGVEVDHAGLASYAGWAAREHPGDYALHSSIGFDLTITSLFVPLIGGHRLKVYPETGETDLAILDVFREDAVDVVKLTPAHLNLVIAETNRISRIHTLILGGEALMTDLAERASGLHPSGLTIANEYGPTEAVVGAMLHRFDKDADTSATVSIGRPADGVTIAVLDKGGNPTPAGVTGEIHIAGRLARGYHQRADLTQERFVEIDGKRYYRTGDLARVEPDKRVTFLGRDGDQLSIQGVRIEPEEVAVEILKVSGVSAVHVGVLQAPPLYEPASSGCVRCGLSVQAPGGSQTADGICQTCLQYDEIRDRAAVYFKTPKALHDEIQNMRARRTGNYDVIMLLSGGKDSTYALYRLAEMTGDILCLTLDNGFLSDEAKANIRAVAEDLNLDHRFMDTKAMNEIFLDSISRFSNVCQGCFKTIYSLALKVARQEGIPAIATGLSRGQFFETRLTPELFQSGPVTAEALDKMVEEARRSYHRAKDAVALNLGFPDEDDPQIFEEITFLDIYRYIDVPVSEIYRTLSARGWKRPRDTGRSTNCRINDLGIFVHTAREGYHNYAVPYAWDVRLGAKTREEAMAELQDEIDPKGIEALMDEVGLDPDARADGSKDQLVAWYAGSVDPQTVRGALRGRLAPEYMPDRLVQIPSLPLTANGKIDPSRLPNPRRYQRLQDRYEPPLPGAEELLAGIIARELKIPKVGAKEAYHELGGDSLSAIRIAAQATQQGLVISAADIFRHQTVQAIAAEAEDKKIPAVPADPEKLLTLDASALSAIQRALGS
jgi:amino acid adenylation domain-containing protein